MRTIYHFTPYDRRGLGYAYNKVCAIVPAADDWICLMDADVMMLPGDWGLHLDHAVREHREYDVFVCMATRTWRRGDQQLWDPPRIRGCTDLRDLFSVVSELGRTRFGEVVPWPAKRQPSGFFMLFRKDVWLETPFPLAGPKGLPMLGIETEWFRRIRAAGRKVGLMKGLAAIHFYRLDRPEGDLGYLGRKS